MLLAALLSAAGHPARVVGGILLERNGARVVASGHAWVEVRDGGRWRPLDATRPDQRSFAPYLPLFTMRNETASFGRGLLPILGRRIPRRIRLP